MKGGSGDDLFRGEGGDVADSVCDMSFRIDCLFFVIHLYEYSRIVVIVIFDVVLLIAIDFLCIVIFCFCPVIYFAELPRSTLLNQQILISSYRCVRFQSRLLGNKVRVSGISATWMWHNAEEMYLICLILALRFSLLPSTFHLCRES